MTKPAPEENKLTLGAVFNAITANAEVFDLAPPDVTEERLIN